MFCLAAVGLNSMPDDNDQEMAASTEANDAGRALSQAAVLSKPSVAVPSTASRRSSALIGSGGLHLAPSAATRAATAPPSEWPASTSPTPPSLWLNSFAKAKESATRCSKLRQSVSDGAIKAPEVEWPCPRKSAATTVAPPMRSSEASRSATCDQTTPTSPAPCKHRIAPDDKDEVGARFPGESVPHQYVRKVTPVGSSMS